MVDGVRTFDPVGAFQRGRRGALGIERQEQQIAAERTAAPRRNILGDISIQQAQQTLAAGRELQAQQGTTFEQQQAIQQATVGVQVTDALGRLSQDQRGSAFASLQDRLSPFFTPDQLVQFGQSQFTDQDIAQARTAFQSILTPKAPQAGVVVSEKARIVNPITGKVLFEPKAGQLPEDIKFSDFRGVNKDVGALVKDASKIKKAASSLSKLSKTKSATDQLAAIFTFMKSLDPTSVVREAEQDQARSTGGVTDQFIGFINRIQGQGALPENVFTQMVLTAKRLSNQASEDTGVEVNKFLDAFGERLISGDKKRLSGRVPSLFTGAGIGTGQELTEGAIIRNSETGQRKQVVNGQLVDIQ